MSYKKRAGGHGLMGLGAVEDQAPVKVGSRALSEPILSTASVLASDIMLRLAAVAKDKRLDKMVEIMNKGVPGLGAQVLQDYQRRAAASPSNMKDQAMFDAIRAALADQLVARTLALKPGMSGLGQTIAEVRGGTSTGVNDANALFCSYGAGVGSMVGGFIQAFGGSGGGVTGSQTAGSIAGCGAGQLVIQGQIAQQQAQLSQQATAQLLAQQSAQSTRFMQYALMGGGLLAVVFVGAAILKK